MCFTHSPQQPQLRLMMTFIFAPAACALRRSAAPSAAVPSRARNLRLRRTMDRGYAPRSQAFLTSIKGRAAARRKLDPRRVHGAEPQANDRAGTNDDGAPEGAAGRNPQRGGT